MSKTIRSPYKNREGKRQPKEKHDKDRYINEWIEKVKLLRL